MPSRRLVRTKRLFMGREALGVAVGTCGVFLGLGALVRYSLLQAFDLRATRRLQREDWPPLNPVMVGLTNAGDPLVVPALGTAAAATLYKLGLPRAALLVAASLISIPVNIVLKHFWDRARPDADLVNVVVETAGTSFPSGHTMGATAFYGALAALVWIHVDPREARLPVTIVFVSLPLGVGVSRVYLGAHWLSDVIAGNALGLFILVPLIRRYLRAIPADVTDQAKAKNPTPSLPIPSLLEATTPKLAS